MSRGKKYLNLYAGVGGNIDLIDENEYDITNIEIEPNIAECLQKRKPNQKVIVADAHQYLLDHYQEFDFIWSSPGCQSHSRMIRSGRNRKPRYPDFRLYEEIIFLKYNFKGLWIVENVKPYYEPLIRPTVMLGRHCIWSNFKVKEIRIEQPKNFITQSTVASSESLKKWLGIDYAGNLYYQKNHCPGQVLRNCVHPKLGLHIINEAKNHVSANDKRNVLFSY